MTLDELIECINPMYEDGLLELYYQHPDGEHGDGLAKFIVIELTERFNAEATDAAQFEDAMQALVSARDQVDEVITALHAGLARLEMGPDLSEDRCEHGMFFSGAGACPQCGGGAVP